MMRRAVAVWVCQAVGELGVVGQAVEMRQMAGTEGMRVRRVRVIDRRPRRETPAVWLCEVGFESWVWMASCTEKVEGRGVVGVLVVSPSERGWYAVRSLLPRRRTAQGKRKVLLSSNAALRTSAHVMSVMEKPELTRKTMRVDEKVRTEKCRLDMASDGIQTSVPKYCCRLHPYWTTQPDVALRASRRLCKVKPAPSLRPLIAHSLTPDPSTTFSCRSCSLPCQTSLAVQYSNGQVRKLRPISRTAPSRGEFVADMKAEIAIGEPSLHMRSMRLITALRRERS